MVRLEAGYWNVPELLENCKNTRFHCSEEPGAYQRYLVIYTDLQPIAQAQAVGFERPKNPPS